MLLAPGASTSTPGVVAGSATLPVDGERVSTLSGAVPAGTTRVTFRLDDGRTVEASVFGSTWAAWFPGDAQVEPGSFTAYDAAGTVLPLGG